MFLFMTDECVMHDIECHICSSAAVSLEKLQQLTPAGHTQLLLTSMEGNMLQLTSMQGHAGLHDKHDSPGQLFIL